MDEYLAAHRGGGGGGGGGPDPTNSPDRVVEVQAFGPRRVGPNLLIHHPDRFVVRVYRESAPDASEASAGSAGSAPPAASARAIRVYALSDMHTDFVDNMAWIKGLPAAEHLNDVSP